MADWPIFYVDRCLGKAVARSLRAAGVQVELHDDHFAQAALDEDWIPEVTRRGWVILTKDKNIRRPAGEREAVLSANARIITLSSGNMRAEAMANLFVGHLHEIERLAVDQPPPFVAVLSPSGLQVVVAASSDTAEGGEGGTSPAERTQAVYLTRGGATYHADGCRFLAKSKIASTLEQARQKGCAPCSICHPPR